MSSTRSTRSSTDDSQPSCRPTVVKLGGSLLGLHDVTERLLYVVDDLTAPLVLVGGGASADLVRHWDEQGLLTNREAHRLAIAAMSFNARQLAASDARFAFVSSLADAIDAVASRRIPLLDAVSVLAVEEACGGERPAIPSSWDVTSDSLAAWLAGAWNADLWLLKSLDAAHDWGQHVDPWFHTAAEGRASLGWVNLRTDRPTVTRLHLANRPSSTRETGHST